MPEVNRIYHVDAFTFMEQLPDESVDLILTDPPYGIGYQNNFTQNQYQILQGDKIGIDYPHFAAGCYRVLKPDTHAYFFTRFDQYPYHYDCLIKSGFQIKNCLVIEKGQIGGIGDLKGSYANNGEWLIFCQKGRRIFEKTKLLMNTRGSGRIPHEILTYKTRFPSCWFGNDYPKANWNATMQKKYGLYHPTMKNPDFVEWMIQISSKEQELVFDPFMGSGTTAIAAIRTNRKYIGCEIDEAYYVMAENRAANEKGLIVHK